MWLQRQCCRKITDLNLLSSTLTDKFVTSSSSIAMQRSQSDRNFGSKPARVQPKCEKLVQIPIKPGIAKIFNAIVWGTPNPRVTQNCDHARIVHFSARACPDFSRCVQGPLESLESHN